jgi:hypothetical protein
MGSLTGVGGIGMLLTMKSGRTRRFLNITHGNNGRLNRKGERVWLVPWRFLDRQLQHNTPDMDYVHSSHDVLSLRL